jgi:STE24 endopeptidase
VGSTLMPTLALALVLTVGRDVGAEVGPSRGGVPPDGAWGVIDWDPVALMGVSRAELASFHHASAVRRVMSVAGTAVGFAFYLAFLFGPLSPWLMRAAERGAKALAGVRPFQVRPLRAVGAALARAFGPDWAAALLFTYGYLGLGVLVGLPFWIAAEALDRRAGLSRYTTFGWVVDLARGELLAAAAATLLVLGLFGVVRRAPRRWWLLVGGPAALLLLAQGLLDPVEVRLANHVTPLADGALRERLAGLARAEGFELSAIRVVEASRVTARLDARLVGLGPTRELLLYDTLLAAADPGEIEAAVAHELGHQRHRVTGPRHAAAALALIALLWVLSSALTAAAPRLGLRGPGDVRALPFVMLVASLCFLAARPARLALARHEERLADRAALIMTGDPEAFVRLHLAIARTNQIDLDPSTPAVIWFASHPTVRERVGTALWYRRWLDERARSDPPGER